MSDFFQLEIKKDGIWKPLCLDSQKGTLQLNNSLFRKSITPGSYTFPINLSWDGNAEILGYPDVINNVNIQKIFTARMKLFGGTWCCGRIKVLKANCDRIRIVFQDNQGEFKDLIEGVSIKNICSETHNIECGELESCRHYKMQILFDSNGMGSLDVLHVFEINGISVSVPNGPFGSLLDLVNELIATVNAPIPGYGATLEYIGEAASENGEQVFFKVCSKDPIDYPFLNYYSQGDPNNDATLEPFDPDGLDTYAGGSINQCFIDYITGLANATTPQTHSFPTIYMPNAYNDNNPYYSCYVNYYNANDPDTPGYLQNNLTLEEGTKFAFAPQVNLKFVLQCIEEFTGYKFKGDILEDPCFCKITLKNNRLMDNIQNIDSSYLANGELIEDSYMFNVAPTSYDIGDYLPDVSIQEILQVLQTFGEFKFDKYEKCITITNRNEALNKPKTSNWTAAICGIFDICLPEPKGFSVKFKKPGKDEKFDESDELFAPYNSAESSGTVCTLKWAPIGIIETREDKIGFGTNSATKWILPCYLGPATTDFFDVGENPCGLRLFFYHGLQPRYTGGGAPGGMYPFASPCNVNAIDEILCDWDLKIIGDSGIYAKFFKAFMESNLSNQKVMGNVEPTCEMIANYDPCSPIEIDVNGVRTCILIESLNLQFDENGFAPTSKLTGLKI